MFPLLQVLNIILPVSLPAVSIAALKAISVYVCLLLVLAKSTPFPRILPRSWKVSPSASSTVLSKVRVGVLASAVLVPIIVTSPVFSRVPAFVMPSAVTVPVTSIPVAEVASLVDPSLLIVTSPSPAPSVCIIKGYLLDIRL